MSTIFTVRLAIDNFTFATLTKIVFKKLPISYKSSVHE